MKSLKTIIYGLILVMAFSCNTNEEVFEAESQLEQNLQRGSDIGKEFTKRKMKDGKVKTNLSNMGRSRDFESLDNSNPNFYKRRIYYISGTTESQKALFRNSYGLQIGLISWTTCPINQDIEIWTIIGSNNNNDNQDDSDDDDNGGDDGGFEGEEYVDSNETLDDNDLPCF